eukprot:14820724-Heterocapsa_arctica.AAC.1
MAECSVTLGSAADVRSQAEARHRTDACGAPSEPADACVAPSERRGRVEQARDRSEDRQMVGSSDAVWSLTK